MKIIRTKGDNPLAKLFSQIPTIESEAEYKKLMIVEELLKQMKDAGINRTELARRMGVANSRITAMLNGTNNLTIETLVRAGRAVGADLHQTFAPAGQKVKWNAYDPAHTHAVFRANMKPRKITTVSSFSLTTLASDDDSAAA